MTRAEIDALKARVEAMRTSGDLDAALSELRDMTAEDIACARRARDQDRRDANMIGAARICCGVACLALSAWLLWPW